MLMHYFYDTSAILAGAIKQKMNDCCGRAHYICPTVLKELEHIKTSATKTEETRAQAREFLRFLRDNSELVHFTDFSNKDIERHLKRYSHILEDNNDARIIIQALLLKEQMKNPVILVTGDLLLNQFAKRLNITCELISEIEKKEEFYYAGFTEEHPDEITMAALYSDPTKNHFNTLKNGYIKVYEEDTLRDILKWNGERYVPLCVKPFKNTLGEKINARNPEQKMYFDLLEDRSTPIKLCLGRFGSGKSYLALAHALDLVRRGEFDKIVFVRNSIEVKDAGKIGYLPGSDIDKLFPYIQPIADHIGAMNLEEYIQRGMIEPVPLGFIRGRDLKHCILIADECENLTKQHVQLLMGRISEGSEVWFIGDFKQTDSPTFEKNSGMQTLIQKLAGDELFGMVKLLKSERSSTAAKADLLD